MTDPTARLDQSLFFTGISMLGDPVFLRNGSDRASVRLGCSHSARARSVKRTDCANLGSSTSRVKSGACQRSAYRVHTQCFSITFKALLESGVSGTPVGTGERLRRRE